MKNSYTQAFLNSSLFIVSIFLFTYYPTNQLAAIAGEASCLSMSIDVDLPYLEIFYLPYYLIIAYPLFLLLYKTSMRKLYSWRNTLIIGIFVASGIHLAFPTKNCFSGNLEDGFLWRVTKMVGGEFNMVPSIHAVVVTVTTIVLLQSGGASKMIISCLFSIFLISPLLTHQHGFFDVITGVFLGLAVFFVEDYFAKCFHSNTGFNK